MMSRSRPDRRSSKPPPARCAAVGSNGISCLQGHPLRRADRRRQPLHAAASARALGRGARRARLYAAQAPQLPGRPERRPELRTILGPADTSPESEDCLTLNVWTPGHRRRREAAGHGVAAWRRVRLRLGQPRSHRRRQSGAARRCRRGQRQPSPEHLRLSAPRRYRRRALCAFRQCRDARPRRRARMGARQYRAVRRRSRQCHDLRRVGRRREGQRAAGDAGGARAVPPRRDPERRRGPGLDPRARRRAGRSRAAGTRHRAQRLRPAAEVPAEQLAAAIAPASRAVGRPALPLLDRYDFGPVVDGDRPAAAALRPGRPGHRARHPAADRRHARGKRLFPGR